MKKETWEEIKVERRQLWCEALLLTMQDHDPMIEGLKPEQIADRVLAAYDARFSSELTPDQERQRSGDRRRPGHPLYRPEARPAE